MRARQRVCALRFQPPASPARRPCSTASASHCGRPRKASRTRLMQRLFWPTARQWNVLITLGFLALGYALYLRYLAIEQTPVGLACEAGLGTWLCRVRQAALTLQQNSVFGTVAVGAAALNVIRPSLVLLAIALMVSCFGVVLYSSGLSGLAVGLITLGFARPV